MPNTNIIDVQHLKKSFGRHIAVRDLNLTVQQGEVFGFLGPNGSGKTTSIRMLCGLLTPDAGKGHCLGFDILKESRHIKKQVGYMTQKFSFYTDLSVEENLNFIAQVYDISDSKKRAQAVDKVLDEMNLTERRKQLTAELSGGWKQRMAFAACLLHQPKLLLLDEPTAGIDPIARREFWDMIHRLSEAGITTLISTHYMDEAERCTRLAYLAYGDLIITGTVDDVIKATHLKTWELRGEISTHLLQAAQATKGVIRAAYFGRYIHVCGVKKAQVESGLKQLEKKHQFDWHIIDSTLEDAFIRLVEQTTGESK